MCQLKTSMKGEVDHLLKHDPQVLVTCFAHGFALFNIALLHFGKEHLYQGRSIPGHREGGEARGAWVLGTPPAVPV